MSPQTTKLHDALLQVHNDTGEGSHKQKQGDCVSVESYMK